MDNKTQAPRYTTIVHSIRLSLQLTCNEYCIADIIFCLSNNPENKVAKGWCYASKETIGLYIGVHKTTVIIIVKKLIEMGLIEKDDESKYLRTTKLWYDTVVTERLKFNIVKGSETLPRVAKHYQQGSETLPLMGSETLPNNNIIYNNNNKLIVATATDTPQKSIKIKEKDKEFIFKSKLTELKESNRRISNIVALYWEYKGIEFKNYDQYEAGFKRELNPAKNLVGYSNDQVERIMAWLNENADYNWTLETCHKLIDQPNLKSFKKQTSKIPSNRFNDPIDLI